MAGSTTLGFPYPTATDAWNAHTAIQALATAVDTYVAGMLKRGYFSGSANASGVVTITHNLGVVPASVSTQRLTVGSDVVDGLTQLILTGTPSATQAQFVIRRADTGAALTGNPVNFYWTVFR